MSCANAPPKHGRGSIPSSSDTSARRTGPCSHGPSRSRSFPAIWSIAHVKSTSRSWRCTISLPRIPLKKGGDDEVAADGRNLCVYANTLDDLIAGEERELFPVMRRVLFRHPQT